MKRYILPTVFSVMALAPFALSAQNTLISGSLNNAANWDDGALPSTANPGNNPGVIDSSNTGANQGVLGGITDLIITQTGGDVDATAFGWKDLNGSTDYTITGGNLNIGSFGLRIQGSSVLTINGGTASGGSRWNNDNILNVFSGVASTGELRAISGSEFNFTGGTTTISGNAFNDSNSGNTGAYTVNFSGTASFSAGTFGGVNAGGTTVNIGAGTGSITATTLEGDDFTFDWTSGSEFTFEATTITGTSVSWEDLWDAGNLLVDGVQTGTFTDNFVDSSGVLSLVPVPEPSTFAFLSGLLSLSWVMLRRRA